MSEKNIPTNDSESTRKNIGTFLIEEAGGENFVPESITGIDHRGEVEKTNDINVETISIYLKRLLLAFATLVITLIIWDVIQIYLELRQLSPTVGYGFLIFVTIILSVIIYSAVRYVYDDGSSKTLDRINRIESEIDSGETTSNGSDLTLEMTRYYQGKPQEKEFQASLKLIPDYSTDKEMLNLVDSIFLRKLDVQAQNVVSNYSIKNGVCITVSHWVSLDMFLVLWQNWRMISEVAQIYGTRPTLPNRLILLKQIAKNSALAGVSEHAARTFSELTDLVADTTSQAMLGVVTARVAQGVGVGVYTSRIGSQAIRYCRPLQFRGVAALQSLNITDAVIKAIRSKFSSSRD